MNIKECTSWSSRLHQLGIAEGKLSMFNTRQKLEEIFIKCAKIVGANFQCVNNYYAKFEYIGMNTVGVTDYTN